jgi:hypothetical protein
MDKSLAELDGWTFGRRVQGAYQRLKEHVEWLAALDRELLQDNLDKIAERKAKISEDLNDSAKDFMRQVISESADRMIVFDNQLADDSFQGAINLLEPVFGKGAVEAAMDRIRKDVG